MSEYYVERNRHNDIDVRNADTQEVVASYSAGDWDLSEFEHKEADQIDQLEQTRAVVDFLRRETENAMIDRIIDKVFPPGVGMADEIKRPMVKSVIGAYELERAREAGKEHRP